MDFFGRDGGSSWDRPKPDATVREDGETRPFFNPNNICPPKQDPQATIKLSDGTKLVNYPKGTHITSNKGGCK